MAARKWTSWQGEDLAPEYDFTEPTSNVHVIWPEIEVGGRAWKGESDVGSVPLRDERGETGDHANLPAGLSLVSIAAHNRFRWTERNGSNTMARGWIGPKDYRRDREGGLKPDRWREIGMSVLDANAQLQGIMVDANRDAETDVARVQWLRSTYLAGSPRATTNLAITYLATGSNTVNLPAQHVFGDPRSVLEEIANFANKQFFVTSDEELFYDGNDSAAYVAGLRISDRPSEQETEAFGTPEVVGFAHELQNPALNEIPFTISDTNQLLLFALGKNSNTGDATVTWSPQQNDSSKDQTLTLLHEWFDQAGFWMGLYGLWNPTPTISNSELIEDDTSSADRGTHGVFLVDGYASDPTGSFTYAANAGVGTSGTCSVTAGTRDLVLSTIFVNNQSTSVNATGTGQILLDWEGGGQWMGAISEQPGAGGSTTSGYSYTGADHGNQWQIGQVVLGSATPTFPPIWDVGPAATEDGQQLLSGLRLYYGQGTDTFVYVNDPVTANKYSHYEEALYAPDTVTTAAAATTLANAILQRRRFEDRNINVSIGPLTIEQAILVKYGQLIDIKARAISFADDNFFTGRIRQLRWTTPVPDMFFAHMQIDRPVKDVPYGVGNRSGSTAIDSHLASGSNSHPEFVPRALLTTQGDLPYRGASDWTRLGIGGSNTVLTSLGTGVPTWQTPTGGGPGGSNPNTVDLDTAGSTTSLTSFSDSNLSVALVANTNYIIDAGLFFNTNATSVGIRFAFNGPAGATVKIGGFVSTGAAGTNDSTIAQMSVIAYDTAFITTTGPGLTNAVAKFFGTIRVGGTAGNLIVRHASETATATSIESGSYLRVMAI